MCVFPCVVLEENGKERERGHGKEEEKGRKGAMGALGEKWVER